MQEGNEGRRGEGAGRSESESEETRLQQGGEGGTTRFGMEEGDNTDIATTGGPQSDEEE